MTTLNATLNRFRISPIVLILLALMALAVLVALARYLFGIGAISNLNDAYPWGMWISFDLLCGVALAAGAFTTASAVYIFNDKRFTPILRPAILTGFLGYLMVIIALLVDLGRPERIWHLIIYWNPHSVMFEVGWCVMLYTTVLALEFSPLVFERFGWKLPLNIVHRLTMVFVILGTLLSTLHQSSLGSLFLATPGKVSPLWFSAFLPVYFFLTAAAVGPAMVIVESFISSRAFYRGLETELLGTFAKVIPPVLGIYLLLKVIDLTMSGKWAYAFRDGMSVLFWIEIIGFVILPIVLFSMPKVRQNGRALFGAGLLVVVGVVFNRLNVSLIGWPRPADTSYFPHWMEFAITFGIIAAGVVAYALVAKFLPLFVEDPFTKRAKAVSPEILRRSQFLVFPDAARVQAVAAIAEELDIDGDQVIFRQGEPAEALYILLEGSVNLYSTRGPGAMNELHLGTIGPGEPFGISTLIAPFKLTASARATTPCRVLKIDGKQLRALGEADPQLGQTLAQRAAQAALTRMSWARTHLAGAQG
ncbi:MAG: NrfD/PsrC family molybdoenzyme membrane anchor subunit [Chloroflexota bacterium]